MMKTTLKSIKTMVFGIGLLVAANTCWIPNDSVLGVIGLILAPIGFSVLIGGYLYTGESENNNMPQNSNKKSPVSDNVSTDDKLTNERSDKQ